MRKSQTYVHVHKSAYLLLRRSALWNASLQAKQFEGDFTAQNENIRRNLSTTGCAYGVQFIKSSSW